MKKKKKKRRGGESGGGESRPSQKKRKRKPVLAEQDLDSLPPEQGMSVVCVWGYTNVG